MIKLSIIIPVYNSASLVHLPLKSVLQQQDMCSSEYEVICINDGSTDESLTVLNDYVKKYSNVKVISQLNKGLGGARNTGIENAKGKYILFVDADDYIIENSLNFLYKKANDGALDILEFGAQGVKNNGSIVYCSTIKKETNILTGEAYIASIHYMNSACNKLYARQHLIKNKLLFLERVYIEDIEFNTRTFIQAKRVMAIPAIIGQFVQTEGSITRSTSYTNQLKMMEDMLIVIGTMHKYIQENISKKSCAYLNLNKRISFLITSLLHRSLKEGRDIDVQKRIVNKLVEIELYPIKFSTNSILKDLFRLFANQQAFYLLACHLFNKNQNIV
ncbi:MAG: glycosyltransferase [Labilibaculum sp.]|nr:glycosyltransferase [Labilibaculum sp.]